MKRAIDRIWVIYRSVIRKWIFAGKELLALENENNGGSVGFTHKQRYSSYSLIRFDTTNYQDDDYQKTV